MPETSAASVTPRALPGAEEALVAQPGVNCWRDGAFLALQRDAVFPKRFLRANPWAPTIDISGKRGREIIFPAHGCAKCGDSTNLSAQSYPLSGRPSWVESIMPVSMVLACGFFLIMSVLPSVKTLLPWKFLALFIPLLLNFFWILIRLSSDRGFSAQISLCASHQKRRWISPFFTLEVTFFVIFVSWLMSPSSFFLVLFFAFLGIGFVLALVSLFLYPWISVAKLDEDYIYIKGCDEAFLASLPELVRKT